MPSQMVQQKWGNFYSSTTNPQTMCSATRSMSTISGLQEKSYHFTVMVALYSSKILPIMMDLKNQCGSLKMPWLTSYHWPKSSKNIKSATTVWLHHSPWQAWLHRYGLQASSKWIACVWQRWSLRSCQLLFHCNGIGEHVTLHQIPGRKCWSGTQPPSLVGISVCQGFEVDCTSQHAQG